MLKSNFPIWPDFLKIQQPGLLASEDGLCPQRVLRTHPCTPGSQRDGVGLREAGEDNSFTPMPGFSAHMHQETTCGKVVLMVFPPEGQR